MKLYFAGTNGVFSDADTANEVIELSGKKNPNILYIGTASYDDPGHRQRQGDQFENLGCEVKSLEVSYKTDPNMADLFKWADVILVSGGNTFFATRRWQALGVDKLIRKAGTDGKVLTGGSAGAIVWFDGGHSDSMDPASYKNPPGPMLNPNLTDDQLKRSWSYVRTDGLGMLPGLFCPHYDSTGSNGILRADSFTKTLRSHPGEYGIALDNFAAISIENGNYKIVSRANKTGSHTARGEFTKDFAQGVPGAWSMFVDSKGQLVRTDVPETGKTTELFRKPRFIAQDEILPVAALQNPDDGKQPSPRPKKSKAA